MEPLRIGMVGGGPGAFIGAVHRMALALDGCFRLTAGAFSADATRSRQTGAELALEPGRVYASYADMAAAEAALPVEQRIQAVAIVTPNHVHFPAARAFLEAGIAVICDKPLAVSVAEAEELAALTEQRGLPFCVTHNYTGYPLVWEARRLVAEGALGNLRKVYVEYLQGWLHDRLEATGQKQASWRTDPAQAGPCGAMGDIGTHAHNLVEFVTQQPVQELLAVLQTFVPGRALDDDGMVLLKLRGGATGTLTASQVCVGQENGLRLRLFGDRGGLAWAQEAPNDLVVYHPDRAPETRRPGNAWVTGPAATATRLPAGHPEGYLEAFANLYREFATAIRGGTASFPTVREGLRGMQFLEAVLRSSSTGAWVTLPA